MLNYRPAINELWISITELWLAIVNHGYIHNQSILAFHTFRFTSLTIENYEYLILFLLSIMVNYRQPDDNWIMDNCCESLTLSYMDIHNWVMDIHN